jgi:hypothetical protein
MLWKSQSKLKYRSARVSDRRTRWSLTGQLQPSIPKENHAGDDRSQGEADVARRGKRGEEISKADRQRLRNPISMKS